MDPLADSYDSYSPYNYALNDPIGKLDPDGRSVERSEAERNTLGLSDKRQPDELDSGPGDGKKKPEPKPIMLEEVVVYGKRSSSTVNARKDALDWAGTALDVTGTSIVLHAENKMMKLMNQGYASGSSGLIRASAQSAKSLAGFGSALGNSATAISVGILYLESKQFRRGKMSGARFGYHVGSFGVSAGVGLFAGGGPYGVVIGLAAKSAEMGYDISKDAFYTLNGQWNHIVQTIGNSGVRR